MEAIDGLMEAEVPLLQAIQEIRTEQRRGVPSMEPAL